MELPAPDSLRGGGAKWIPSRSAEGPLARTPLGWWPQAEAGTEQRRAKENDVIWTPGGRETTELAAEHLGTPDEPQCSGFPGSPRGAPRGGRREEEDEAASTTEWTRQEL